MGSFWDFRPHAGRTSHHMGVCTRWTPDRVLTPFSTVSGGLTMIIPYLVMSRNVFPHGGCQCIGAYHASVIVLVLNRNSKFPLSSPPFCTYINQYRTTQIPSPVERTVPNVSTQVFLKPFTDHYMSTFGLPAFYYLTAFPFGAGL